MSVEGSPKKKRPALQRENMAYGRVLVVDDMQSNLDVIKLLLKPYGIEAATAKSGFDAIGMSKADAIYDIIFMDHMMPGIDGIETTKKIRELGYTRPIAALTANDADGQSELFLANGFDAFISKPINVGQLDSMLKKFVKDKHQPGAAEAANNPHEEEGSWLALYPQLAETFARDLTASTGVLQAVLERGSYGDEDLQAYTINVHAMKNVLANMGETELSAAAATLEQAGREKNAAIIASKTHAFLEKLKAIIEKLISQQKAEENTNFQSSEEDEAYLREKLLAIKAASENYDKRTIDKTLTELKQRKWPGATKELLSAMSELLLSGDFDALAKRAEMA
jgi:CheY-like chemotaxis protein